MMRRTNIASAVRAALWLLTSASTLTSGAQGLNNLWMGGYASDLGPPWGGVDIDFSSGAPQISYVDREMQFGRASTNITDSAGSPLFATNGFYIANAMGDTMLNGSGLNPSPYTSQFSEGLSISQAGLILPVPDAAGYFYLFHNTIDDLGQGTAQYLYLTTIDMDLDGGSGGVVIKNQILIDDVLNQGKITAVKHANGRDWWVICHKANSSTYYRLLVTPDGISPPETQSIGTVRPPDAGQVCFSPDGSRFAYYWGIEDLDILDFDRCSGLFSNPRHVDIDDYDQMGGVAFSPNNRFLYVSSVLDVYQFDLSAPDVAASMLLIAQWDSTYSPGPPFATVFDVAQLAPDGKIYLATGNSTDRLHVVNDPDEEGLDCDLEQHAIELPAYFQNSLPNHPNYHLGPLVGSPCDTLGLGLADHAPPGYLHAYPNPCTGDFTLSYAAQHDAGTLDIRDVGGKLLLRERLPPWSTVHAVSMPDAGPGIYQCSLRWGTRAQVARVVVE